MHHFFSLTFLILQVILKTENNITVGKHSGKWVTWNNASILEYQTTHVVAVLMTVKLRLSHNTLKQFTDQQQVKSKVPLSVL